MTRPTELWVVFDPDGSVASTDETEREAKDFAERSGFSAPVEYVPAQCPNCQESYVNYCSLIGCDRCQKVICHCCAAGGLCEDCDVDVAIEHMETGQEDDAEDH